MGRGVEDFPLGQVRRTKGFEVENRGKSREQSRDSFDLLTCSGGFTARKTAGWKRREGGSQWQHKAEREWRAPCCRVDRIVHQNQTLAAIVFFPAGRCATELQRTPDQREQSP